MAEKKYIEVDTLLDALMETEGSDYKYIKRSDLGCVENVFSAIERLLYELPGADVEEKVRKIRYRNESCYGDGFRDIVDVMRHEIFTLENTDILEYLLDKNPEAFSDELIEDMKQAIGHTEEYGGTDEMQELCTNIRDSLSRFYGKELRYCLWLADKDVVKELYDGNSAESVDAYKVSDYILSDLGRDGTLYAYEDFPEPVNDKEER